MLHELPILFTVGVALFAALSLGHAAQKIHLPRVTAYLLVGLLFAPYSISLLPTKLNSGSLNKTLHLASEQLHLLHPVADLAMALVLFAMGCHFSLVHFRRIMNRALHLSRGETFFTFLCVFAGIGLLGTDMYSACLYGVLALATAPATTMLVLKETESEGPVTEYATTLVALNNLVAVLIFECLFVVIASIDGQLESHWSQEFMRLAISLGLATTLGVSGGLVVSYTCLYLPRKRWLLATMAFVALILGLCESYHLPYLLTFLAMGIVVANCSELAKELVQELASITSFLCVIFFIVHGADMNIGALWAAGMVGVVYIACRTFGKFIGIYATAQKEGPTVRTWLGLTLISQAGAALTLAGQAAARNPDRCLPIQQVILGSVVFFEILGPILVRQAVIRSGETPLDRAISHSTTSPWEGVQELFNRIVTAFGGNPWANSDPSELTVGQLMRRNVKGIPVSADFDAVAHWIEHSHDNTFPVVDEIGDLVGVIYYTDIRDAIFDPMVNKLVRAADLTVEPHLKLTPADPLKSAIDHIRDGSHDAIPVVSAEGEQYLGLVRRKDLIRFFRRSQSEPENT